MHLFGCLFIQIKPKTALECLTCNQNTGFYAFSVALQFRGKKICFLANSQFIHSQIATLLVQCACLILIYVVQMVSITYNVNRFLCWKSNLFGFCNVCSGIKRSIIAMRPSMIADVLRIPLLLPAKSSGEYFWDIFLQFYSVFYFAWIILLNRFSRTLFFYHALKLWNRINTINYLFFKLNPQAFQDSILTINLIFIGLSSLKVKWK